MALVAEIFEKMSKMKLISINFKSVSIPCCYSNAVYSKSCQAMKQSHFICDIFQNLSNQGDSKKRTSKAFSRQVLFFCSGAG